METVHFCEQENPCVPSGQGWLQLADVQPLGHLQVSGPFCGQVPPFSHGQLCPQNKPVRPGGHFDSHAHPKQRNNTCNTHNTIRLFAICHFLGTG